MLLEYILRSLLTEHTRRILTVNETWGVLYFPRSSVTNICFDGDSLEDGNSILVINLGFGLRTICATHSISLIFDTKTAEVERRR